MSDAVIWCIRSLKGKVLANFSHSLDLTQDFDAFARKIIRKTLEAQHPPVVKLTRHNVTYAYIKRIRNESQELEKLQTVSVLVQQQAPQYANHIISLYQTFVDVETYAVFQAAKGIGVKDEYSNVTHSRIVSLEQLLSEHYIQSISLGLVLCAVLQLLILFHKLQSIIPKFSHNDMKLDNVMFEPLLRNEVLEYPEYGIRIPRCPFRVILIDFETVVGDGIPDTANDSIPKQIRELFGYGMDMPFCEYTDFHLLILLIVNQVKMHAPVWAEEFLYFAASWPGVPQFFETYKRGNRKVTRMNRLTSAEKQEIQERIRAQTCPTLRSLIRHPIFDAIIDLTYAK